MGGLERKKNIGHTEFSGAYGLGGCVRTGRGKEKDDRPPGPGLRAGLSREGELAAAGQAASRGLAAREGGKEGPRAEGTGPDPRSGGSSSSAGPGRGRAALFREDREAAQLAHRRAGESRPPAEGGAGAERHRKSC